jgi:hypothetical protein
MDRERGQYGVKEQALARLYADALALPKSDSERLK